MTTSSLGRATTLTVGAALDAAAARLATAGVASPRLDAEVLLADALGLGRAALIARRPEPLPGDALEAFEARVARRAAREPVAYIIGRREFYGLEFEVTRDVLIPRPETELLVEEALGNLPGVSLARAGAHAPRAPEAEAAPSTPRVVDVGTGSGCIAVAIAVHAPAARVVAVDASDAALAVARRNAARHGVAGQIEFVRGDLLAGLDGPFDLVVANLPYVSTEEIETLMPDVRLYEPALALDGGAGDGLALVRALVGQSVGRLASGGLLLLEVAAGQAARVADLLWSVGAFSDVSIRRDLAGIERIVRGRAWTRS
ncbi:MAG TPA: peptide chain release factor N(5)-glutamine methyltransferase [Thermodesulfobacteriota bacterium]